MEGARTALSVMAVGLVAGLITGCSASADPAAPATSPAAPSPVVPSSDAPPSAPAATATAQPSATSPASAASRVFTVADAIFDQLIEIPPESRTAQLVTIAVSPQLRQVTAQYDVTAGMDTRGDKVVLVVEDDGEQCTVSVSDPPGLLLSISCDQG